jgi:hypothetical protein
VPLLAARALSAEAIPVTHACNTSCLRPGPGRYHAQYYRPDNMAVIITGKVEAARVFSAVAGMEAKFAARAAPAGSVPRPWFTNPVPALEKAQDVRIEFPSDEEVRLAARNIIIFKEVCMIHRCNPNYEDGIHLEMPCGPAAGPRPAGARGVGRECTASAVGPGGRTLAL